MHIIKLTSPQNKDAVELLETAIRRVKSGEITAVSLSWVTKSGSVAGDISSGKDVLKMIVSMENNLWYLKNKIFGKKV